MIDIKQLYNQLAEKALRAGQSHIFSNWDQLTDNEKEKLLLQAASLDFEQIKSLAERYMHSKKPTAIVSHFEPVKPIQITGPHANAEEIQKMRRLGELALANGQVAALLVAGGQGSRLGFPGPKGKFPITPVLQKSLFQLHAEKILATCRRYQTRIPFYVMTSDENHIESSEFFADHRYFGLRKADVFFFRQGMMPALDAQGKLIMDAPGHVYMSPNGHGGVLEALSKSGAIQDMLKRGIRYIFYFQVDNILVKICDPIFLGYHIAARAEMSSKAVPKRDAYEKVGVIGKSDGKLGVIEYSDLPDELKTAQDDQGNLLFNAGSIAIHVINLSFIQEFEQAHYELPWHVAYKKVPYLDAQGQTVTPAEPNGYKFEKFIFDALAYVKKSVVLQVDRAEEFSPVKNAEGEDSPQTARRDMTRLFASWFQEAGMDIKFREKGSSPAIEISPLYALDKEEFLRKFAHEKKICTALYLE